MSKDTAKWEFATDFTKVLQDVKDATRKKIMRKAISKGAGVVKAVVVAKAPVRYGFMQRSIRIRVRGYQENLIWVAVIGPKKDFVRTKGKYTRGKHKGEARRNRPANIAHIIERGSKHARAFPFLGPALEATRASYEATVAESVKAQIEQVLARK